MALLVSGTPRGRWISTGVPKLTAKTKVNSRCRQVMMPREKRELPLLFLTVILFHTVARDPGAKESTMHCSTEHSISNPFINTHLTPHVYKTLNELTLIFIQMMVTHIQIASSSLIQSEMASAHTANTTHWNTHPTEVINNTESR